MPLPFLEVLSQDHHHWRNIPQRTCRVSVLDRDQLRVDILQQSVRRPVPVSVHYFLPRVDRLVRAPKKLKSLDIVLLPDRRARHCGRLRGGHCMQGSSQDVDVEFHRLEHFNGLSRCGAVHPCSCEYLLIDRARGWRSPLRGRAVRRK